MSATPDEILAALDPEQQQVARAARGPVCVLAGAGTGKTRAITHRIAYGVAAGMVPASRVLAVTFTARAAGEMRSRLRELGVPAVQARTFHAAALRQLQFFWPRVVGGPPPRLVQQKAALVGEAAHRLGLPTTREAVRDLAGEVEWVKVTLTHPDDYPAAAAAAGREVPGGLDRRDVVRLLGGYEALKRDRGLMDFEDVLVLTVGLLAERADVAETVRSQYAHFVVDEYQDVNPLQQQLLELWLGERDDLCVVGDPNQTIYSFTGASPEHLLGFRSRYPEAVEVRLVRDYRSTPQVVALANGLLAGSGRHGGAVSGPLRAARLQLVGQRADGPAPSFVEYADDEAEAEGVATRVDALRRSGVPLAEVAVLFRTGGQSEALEQALGSRGLPYQVRGGERFFARREVRDAVLLLRGSARAADPSEPLPSTVRSVLSGAGWTPEPPSGASARQRWESLQALVALAERLAAAVPEAGLGELVAELDERASAQHPPPVDGVTLSTLHAAKGLEWDAVFLVGVCEGLLPISLAGTPAEVEEERRLLYVGVTRAREHLQLSWALARTPGGRSGRQPSRFLDDVRPADGRSAGRDGGGRSGGRGSRRAGGPARCRVCGAALTDAPARKLGRCTTCPASMDEALFDRLREWRRTAAEAGSVPAYVVFTDATLTAIAESRPLTGTELARVPGVGPTKLDRYGDAVLALCRGDEAD